MNDTYSDSDSGPVSEDAESLLERFRDWLETTRLEAGGLDHSGNGPAADAGADADGRRAEFGLIQMAEEFTALRHELKLQTKSGRGLTEQAEGMLKAMRQAIDQFRAVEPKDGQGAGRGPGRPGPGPRPRPSRNRKGQPTHRRRFEPGPDRRP